MKKAIYPGSFDPITFGHIDIINRASVLFDEVHVIVTNNREKEALFTLEERVVLIRELFNKNNVKVVAYDGLTVNIAKKLGARYIVRGIRIITDFEYEFQISLINKSLYDSLETVFFMTKPENSFVSSSIIKEVHELGGEINKFVPSNVVLALKNKLK